VLGITPTPHSSSASTRTKTSSKKPSRKPPTSPAPPARSATVPPPPPPPPPPSNRLTGARTSHSSISRNSRATRPTRRWMWACAARRSCSWSSERVGPSCFVGDDAIAMCLVGDAVSDGEVEEVAMRAWSVADRREMADSRAGRTTDVRAVISCG
jgi:hypothetical protein